MKNKAFNILALILAIFMIFTGCVSTVIPPVVEEQTEQPNQSEQPELPEQPEQPIEPEQPEQSEEPEEPLIDENETYTDPYQVAEYIHTYDQLPSNYLTKKEASNLGWESDKGNLWDVTDEMSIGGDKFGNREGLLPKSDGRQYYECDVNYEGGYRGAERIVFSNDGLIFYTDDHYNSFTQLY